MRLADRVLNGADRPCADGAGRRDLPALDRPRLRARVPLLARTGSIRGRRAAYPPTVGSAARREEMSPFGNAGE